MTILGIETSCDETSAAVVRDGREVLSCVTHTQPEHRRWGGVVPELASRCHMEKLPEIVRAAIAQSGVGWSGIDAVAATRGPGLASALLVGWSAAKGIALRTGLPLIAVNHIEAHLHSVFLDPAAPDPAECYPAIGLAISGGHTNLFRLDAPGKIALVGRTVDDAAGEALDKAAKLLGLGYPGGPAIDRISKGLTPREGAFPEGKIHDGAICGGLDASLCTSFSGLKTSLLTRVVNEPPKSDAEVAQIACDYQAAVVGAVVKRCERALSACPAARCLMVGGGVSLNSLLRTRLKETTADRGVRLLLALPAHCGDNAAMIAGLAGMGRGIASPESFDLDVAPSWPVEAS
ncbi:MAG: tRNA (adenosine(37)-N6)-threonylcarbamoyltransferase complex transferase subunit TsaD [Kiritimatiellae bacterium]|nr:tRNA (adenosine(37)-N6)-threonylcarbamoyltransferase complex transferase subunit TsaD [Kiritimatiellia bacterium]